MLKYLKVVFLFMNFVSVLGGECFEKHNIPVNDKNFPVLKRNIGDIHEKGFSAIPKKVYLMNYGFSVVIRNIYENINVTIFGGPYGEDEFILDMMYFNWLKPNNTTADAFPIELHLVFYNRKYETALHASEENYGVTIWSFRYGKNDNDRPVNNFYGMLEDVPESLYISVNQSEQFHIPLNDIINLQMDYYVYQGRLLSNVRKCSPVVVWVEFATMLKITEQEFQLFQKVLSQNSIKIHETIAPNGSIYHNIDMEELPGWEPFNETLSDNLAIKYNGNFMMLGLIMIAELMMACF